MTAPNMAKSVSRSKCDLLAASQPIRVNTATVTTQGRPGGQDGDGQGRRAIAGVDAAEAARRQAVLAHRVQQTRADQQVAVERAEDRAHHRRRRGRGSERPQQAQAELGRHRRLFQLGHLDARDDQVVGEVAPR